MTDTVFICDTCGAGDDGASGVEFVAALQNSRITGVDIQLVSCLNMCDAPLALALRAPGKVAYLFSGVRPAEDLKDTVALLKLYRDAPGGVIEDARPAGRLRFCLTGRLPAV